MSTVDGEPATLAPPEPRPPAANRVWRSRRRVVAGVAGGLASALGVAPLWTRLSFVVLSLFGGLGVVAYLAGWLLLPSGPWAPTPRVARRVVGVVLILAWLMGVVPGGAWWDPLDGPLGLVLLLVGVGVALWSPAAADTEDSAPAGSAWAPPQSPVPIEAGSRPRPPRSILGRVTLGAALLAVAVATAVAQSWATGLMVGGGIAVLVCAVGLVVGAFYGQARWLVVPAVLLAGVSVAGAATRDLGVSLSGSHENTYSGAAFDGRAVPPERIVKGRGDTYLQIDQVDEAVDGEIRVGYGKVRIDAVEGVRLEIVARVGLGTIDMPSGSEEGYRRVATYRSGPPDAPLVRYEVVVGFGRIEVARYAPNPPAPPVTEPPPPGVIAEDGQGNVIYEDGTQRLADGTVVLPDGTRIEPGGAVVLPNGMRIEPSESRPERPDRPTTVPQP